MMTWAKTVSRDIYPTFVPGLEIDSERIGRRN